MNWLEMAREVSDGYWLRSGKHQAPTPCRRRQWIIMEGRRPCGLPQALLASHDDAFHLTVGEHGLRAAGSCSWCAWQPGSLASRRRPQVPSGCSPSSSACCRGRRAQRRGGICPALPDGAGVTVSSGSDSARRRAGDERRRVRRCARRRRMERAEAPTANGVAQGPTIALLPTSTNIFLNRDARPHPRPAASLLSVLSAQVAQPAAEAHLPPPALALAPSPPTPPLFRSNHDPISPLLP